MNNVKKAQSLSDILNHMLGFGFGYGLSGSLIGAGYGAVSRNGIFKNVIRGLLIGGTFGQIIPAIGIPI